MDKQHHERHLHLSYTDREKGIRYPEIAPLGHLPWDVRVALWCNLKELVLNLPHEEWETRDGITWENPNHDIIERSVREFKIQVLKVWPDDVG